MYVNLSQLRKIIIPSQPILKQLTFLSFMGLNKIPSYKIKLCFKIQLQSLFKC